MYVKYLSNRKIRKSTLTIKAVDEVPNVACLSRRNVNDGEAFAVLVLGARLEDQVVVGDGPEHGRVLRVISVGSLLLRGSS